MVLFEINQRFKCHFLKELRVSFKKRISTQIENHKQRKNIATDNKCILGKIDLKFKIQPFMHNNICFDIKSKSFGVKRSMRPFWNK